MFSFGHCPNYLPPIRVQVVIFLMSKTMFKRVLQNQVTMITTIMGVIIVIIILALLMILVLKWPTSIHNMILMSRYKGQLHGGKKGPKKAPPPYMHTHILIGQCPKEYFFLMWGVPKVHQCPCLLFETVDTGTYVVHTHKSFQFSTKRSLNGDFA